MATYLGYPFDPELFLLNWQAADDPTMTAIVESGAIQNNGTIQTMIANGSDYYTIPFYDVLTGNVLNYDGQTDITSTETTGKSQSGIVFGRAASWSERQFVRDFNSGADPMKQIASQTAKFWQKERQKIILKILSGIFGIADDKSDAWDEWQNHTTNLASAGSSATDANKVGVATAAEAVQKAVGDNSNIFTMAMMHSAVALALAKQDQLEFRKGTDANGMTRQLRIADWNGMTVIVDDGVPKAASASVSGGMEYTTYLFGAGAIQHATAPVTEPTELSRDPHKNGGTNYLTTRIRETYHPNGFSYVIPAEGYTHSPTDDQLAAAANWKLVGNPKSIAVARLITNG